MEQFFAASDTGRRRRGDDDVDGVGAGQPRRRPARRAGPTRVRLAHALGPTMIAIAANSPLLGGEVLRLAQHPAAGVEPARLGAVRSDPRCQRRRPGQRLGALRAEGAGDAGARHPEDAVPITDWVPFADWADGRVLLGGRRPTDGRPRLPPDDAVPAGAAARLPGDPLPRQRARRRVARAWSSPSPPCSTTRSPPTSPPRPPNRSPPRGTAPRRSASATGALHEAAIRCVQAAAERAPPNSRTPMQRLVRSVEQGRCPADDFSDRVVEVRDRGRGQPNWRKGSRDRHARRWRSELTTARDRTLRLVDFDDAELHAAVRPADEPAGVGPRAHRLAGGAVAAARQRPAPARACCAPDGRTALRRVRALAGQPRRPAAAAADRCARPTARPCATRRSTRSTALPDGDSAAAFAFGLVVSHENQHDETMLQALSLRSGPPLLDRGAPLPPGRARRGGHVGVGAGRPVRARRRRGRRAVVAGQRTVRARRRRAVVPDRPGARHQRRVARVRRRRRLPRAAVVVGARAGRTASRPA